MVRHIVMWKFKDEAEGKTKEENRRYIKERLEALPPVIPQIRKLEAGINFNTSAMAYDMALYTEFDTSEDLEIYQNHPEHRKVSDYVSKVREARAVVDYTV
jgi:hypothetical protein